MHLLSQWDSRSASLSASPFGNISPYQYHLAPHEAQSEIKNARSALLHLRSNKIYRLDNGDVSGQELLENKEKFLFKIKLIDSLFYTLSTVSFASHLGALVNICFQLEDVLFWKMFSQCFRFLII
jgi:hypothetical protein